MALRSILGIAKALMEMRLFHADFLNRPGAPSETCTFPVRGSGPPP